MRKTVFLFGLIFSTLSVMPQNNDISSVIKIVKEKYAPDGRVEIFDIVATQRNDTVILKGETTSKPAHDELILQAGSLFGQLKDRDSRRSIIRQARCAPSPVMVLN